MKLRVMARLIEIQRVLVRHGLDEFVRETHLYRPLRFVFLASPWTWLERRKQAPRGERLRLALEELGPIFIKFGQALSTRRDLLPPDIAVELAKLQDRVPPFDGATARALIEKSLGKPVTEAFAGRIVNVHPALLPRHGGHGMYGARVHRAVLAAGDTESGATVHLVDAAYDRGAAIVQAHVAVEPGDTNDALAARVLRGEHFILPRAVAALAAGEITAAGGRATVGAAARARFDAPPTGIRVTFPG